MATMIDVARIARVSISTVSHVVNGTRRVEEGTRTRVLAAIDSTGYRQDAVARALRRSRTDSIGLVVSDAGEPAFADMVHGVEHAAAQRGFTLLLANSAEDVEREGRAVHTLLDRRVDGLILARAAESDPQLIAALSEATPPVVLLDRVFPDLPFDQVGTNNRESMARLVANLTGAGHTRIALIAGDTRVPTLRERRDGFTDGVASAHLPLDEQILISGHAEAELASAVSDALHDPAITAVVAASTPLAVVGLRAAQDAGRRIPADLAFAAFDGFNHSDLFSPHITTVRQPAFDMGAAAVALLVDRFASPASSPRTVRLQQTLELRESTEGYGGDRP
jgi:LacI family transcriptional regulator